MGGPLSGRMHGHRRLLMHDLQKVITHVHLLLTAPLRPNTVQLVRLDGGVWWVLGLGPVGVGGAFDVPFRHLAFDHPGG